MITYNEIPGTNIAEIMVGGKVTKENFDALVPKLEKLIQEHGSVRLLEEIRDFGGFDLSILWDDMKFAFGHMKDFERVAVVTDKRWIKNWAKLSAVFIKAEVELFELNRIEDARAWLGTK
ncbi:MAG: hypothetical protein PWP23_1368 [Candidatus Sumerlaeota bacterium]|nr:hypothetical protein [Candidatus Sumerlaeota bacterium]